MIMYKPKGEVMSHELTALNLVGGAEHAQTILRKRASYQNDYTPVGIRHFLNVRTHTEGQGYELRIRVM